MPSPWPIGAGSPGPVGPPGAAGAGITVNRISNGNVGGTTLVGLNCTPYLNGTLAAVFSVGAIFELDKTPTAELLALVDDINVVASTFTVGAVWVRQPNSTASGRFAANPPLFINAATGSDDNDGLLAGTALKTIGEWGRRLDKVTLAGLIIVTITGNVGNLQPTTILSNGCRLRFIGAAPTQGTAGTISGTTSDAAATGQEATFTSTAGPVIADDSRLKLLTSATPSHVGMVTYCKGNNANALKPYTKPWAGSSTVPGTQMLYLYPSNGDTFCVETLNATITGLAINWVEVGPNLTAGYLYTRDIIFAQQSQNGSWLYKTSAKSSEADGHWLAEFCTFTSHSICDFSQAEIYLRNCDVKGPTAFSATDLYPIENSMFRGRMTTDICGIQIWGAVCIDSAAGIGFTVGPDTVFITEPESGTPFICVSRSNGDYCDVFFGAAGLALRTCVCWSPVVGGRNGLSRGMVLRSGAFVSCTGGSFQTDFIRSTSVLGPRELGNEAVSFPSWDARYNAGFVLDV